jgi:hypothetical protein
MVVVVAGVSAGCKQETPPQLARDTTPAVPAPEPVSVVGVDLGRAVGPDHRVTAPTNEFGVTDTIYASVATVGSASGAALAAKWTIDSDKLVDSTVVPITPTGPATTEFHIMKQGPWPTGKYKVAILLDGKATMEREFEVKK